MKSLKKITRGMIKLEAMAKSNSDIVQVFNLCKNNQGNCSIYKYHECCSLVDNIKIAKEHKDSIKKYASYIILGN